MDNIHLSIQIHKKDLKIEQEYIKAHQAQVDSMKKLNPLQAVKITLINHFHFKEAQL